MELDLSAQKEPEDSVVRTGSSWQNSFKLFCSNDLFSRSLNGLLRTFSCKVSLTAR